MNKHTLFTDEEMQQIEMINWINFGVDFNRIEKNELPKMKDIIKASEECLERIKKQSKS